MGSGAARRTFLLSTWRPSSGAGTAISSEQTGLRIQWFTIPTTVDAAS